ncbi:MAG: adenylosuccinate lyase [Tenericutes bacterium]|nr:adenylosuccinate lyase [Mycoplasmatota bacterium]
MINRYSREEMRKVWSDESKFDAFLKIELLNAEALNKLGIVPDSDLELLRKNANYDINTVYKLEKELKHDVIAFTRAVSLSLGEEKRFIHYGLTSTDVVDTAYGYLYKQANAIIKKDIIDFLELLKRKAYEYKDTFCIGRTHGIHADITIFGLKFCLYYDELKRNYERFLSAASQVEIGKISGAVGNYAFVNPEIEEYVCNKLEINKAKISTQTLQRDRQAHYISSIVLLSSTIEKIALEVRNLQRTEVNEVREPFSKNQKGSSAMPHKKNPIVSENMCGITRILRGYLIPAFEDIALWHERDISHSSVERVIIPDATMLIDYMYNRYYKIIDGLQVYPENMLENINKTKGIIYSQRILTSLIDKGISREEAYDLIQPLASYAYENQKDFKELVITNLEMKKIYKEDELESLFDINYYKKNIDLIYHNVFN